MRGLKLYILGWSCEVFLKGRCYPKTWLLRWKMCALVVQMDVYVCVAGWNLNALIDLYFDCLIDCMTDVIRNEKGAYMLPAYACGRVLNCLFVVSVASLLMLFVCLLDRRM